MPNWHAQTDFRNWDVSVLRVVKPAMHIPLAMANKGLDGQRLPAPKSGIFQLSYDERLTLAP